MNSKIMELEQLAVFVAEQKAAGRKVVHCHGCFDLLHIGHIRHFQRARELGDVLVVTVTPDKFVNKGPGRPVFPEDLRSEAIAALDCVDAVAKNRWPQAVETIRMVKPSLYVKGSEYKDAAKDVTGGIAVEEEAVESVGGKLAFTDDIVFSSSNLINRHMSGWPRETREFLDGFVARHPAASIIDWLKQAHKLKVLVVGETIIDEYEYCESIGKSSKEPTLAVKKLHDKKFAGGILAVANHVADFVEQTRLVTMLGEIDSHEDFVRRNLKPSVAADFLIRKDSPTILKKRIIEHYFFTKMLEIYSINDADLTPDDNRSLCERLERVIDDVDLVIVADFGHSMITKDAVKIITDRAKFLALNVQANAGNMGYNVVSKYPRADYISLAEKEMRLESRDLRGELKHMLENVSHKLSCPRVVVTRGRNGSLCYDRKDGFCFVPAFAREVVDRVGAGDASLSISSLLAAVGAPMEVVGFVGNAVGAWAVSVVCNEKSVDRTLLYRQIETLLK